MKNEAKKSGLFLTFGLGAELFAIDFNSIIRLADKKKLRKLPMPHKFMVGKINYNGYFLPIIDLRKKLNILPSQTQNETAILVLKLQGERQISEVGVVVDFINEIIEFDAKNMYSAPENGSLYEQNFITDIAKHNDKYYFNLNIDNIFMDEDFNNLTTHFSSTQLKYAV